MGIFPSFTGTMGNETVAPLLAGTLMVLTKSRFTELLAARFFQSLELFKVTDTYKCIFYSIQLNKTLKKKVLKKEAKGIRLFTVDDVNKIKNIIQE